MKTSVLINNYNYAPYVAEAIQSVVNQTNVPDELIIVDDGSSDGSVEVIRKHIADIPYAKLIVTKNKGQLSAVNEGIMASTGDLLFFLDSDDCYNPEHIDNCLNVFNDKPHIGFIYTSHERIGKDQSVHHTFSQSRQLGVCVLTTRFHHAYLGSITSTMAIKRKYLTPLFPINETFYTTWKTRADSVLTWGAGLTGACKYFLKEPSVLYRIHKTNHFTGTFKNTLYDQISYNLASEQIINHMWQKLNYSNLLAYSSLLEFSSIERPTAGELRGYIKLFEMAGLPLRKRTSLAFRLYKKYRKNRRGLKN